MGTDLRQSEEWGRYLSSQGWKIAEIKDQKSKIKIYIKELPLIGSVIKIQRPSVIPPVKTIDKLARKHRALCVKLEPALKPRNTVSFTSEVKSADTSKVFPCRGGGIGEAKELAKAGFVPDKSPSLPTKTIVIDLTKSEEELWRNLSQDTRQSIRKGESYQLSVISYRCESAPHPPFPRSARKYGGKDPAFGRTLFPRRLGNNKSGMRPQVKFAKLQEFHRLLKETSRRQGFWAPNFNQLKAKTKAFGKNAILFLAYPPSSRQRRASEGQALPSQPNNQITESPNHPIAGALILLHDGIAYYHHAATSIAGRKLDATYLLMWEIIKFLVTHSPSNPVTQLDLGGIYDHRYHKATKKWQNFSIFKQKWGGQEVEYPIPLIKYYHPVVKLVFKLGSLFN